MHPGNQSNQVRVLLLGGPYLPQLGSVHGVQAARQPVCPLTRQLHPKVISGIVYIPLPWQKHIPVCVPCSIGPAECEAEGGQLPHPLGAQLSGPSCDPLPGPGVVIDEELPVSEEILPLLTGKQK